MCLIINIFENKLIYWFLYKKKKRIKYIFVEESSVFEIDFFIIIFFYLGDCLGESLVK